MISHLLNKKIKVRFSEYRQWDSELGQIHHYLVSQHQLTGLTGRFYALWSYLHVIIVNSLVGFFFKQNETGIFLYT